MTFSSGTASGATTSTSIPRSRSEAATSRPMKLAPTTTACLAPLAFTAFPTFSTMAWLSANDRSVNTGTGSAPGIDNRTGSAPVAISSAPKPRRAPPSSTSSRALTSIDATRVLSTSSMPPSV